MNSSSHKSLCILSQGLRSQISQISDTLSIYNWLTDIWYILKWIKSWSREYVYRYTCWSNLCFANFIWMMEKLALCNDYNTNSFQRYWRVFLVDMKSLILNGADEDFQIWSQWITVSISINFVPNCQIIDLECIWDKHWSLVF